MKSNEYLRTLFFFLLFFSTYLYSNQIILSNHVYVDSSNTTGIEDGSLEHPFNTIIEGLNISNPGDTIFVSSGTYDGKIYDIGSVTLIGEDPHNTVIIGYVALRSNNATLQGFTIKDSGRSGIEIHNTSNVSILNNIICNNSGTGIDHSWAGPSSSVIINNTIVNNDGWGVFINNPGSSSIVKNNIIAYNGYDGLAHQPGEFDIQHSYNTFWKNRSPLDDDLNSEIGEIYTFPGLVSLDDNDFRLQIGSPCIDAGDPDTLYNDNNGTRNDMGAFGGSNSQVYVYPDCAPIIDNATTSGFINPGDSVIISSRVYDLAGYVSSVVADIRDTNNTLIASVTLYDDGNHDDNSSNDNLWANSWITNLSSMTYTVDIVASDNLAHSDTLFNCALFTTSFENLPIRITDEIGDEIEPTVCQTEKGRIILVYYKEGVSYIYSDDNGKNWSESFQITSSDMDMRPDIASTRGDTVFVTYDRDGDIWYRISHDNGDNWSQEYQLTNDPQNENVPRIASGLAGQLTITWENWDQSKVHYATSEDNGETWEHYRLNVDDPSNCYYASAAYDPDGHLHFVYSRGYHIWHIESTNHGKNWSAPVQITSSGGYKYYASIDIDDMGYIWVACPIFGEYDYDIYYIFNNGEWSSEIQFTKFVGNDSSPDVSVLNNPSNEPWIFWTSNRYSDSFETDIWAGVLGKTQDLTPPPRILKVEYAPYSPSPSPNDIISIKADIIDEALIKNAQLKYSVNGQDKPNMYMYDDGAHYDNSQGDGIWGIGIGTYPVGTKIKYQVLAEDASGNIVIFPTEPDSIEVIGPFQGDSRILLVGDYKYGYARSYLPYYTNALDTNGYSYDTWDCFQRGAPDSTIINQYIDGAIIWFTPYISEYDTYSYIENDTTQSYITNYLDAGGKLFISSQYIGSSLGNTHFYRDYLHAEFVQDVEILALEGVTGDPITDGLDIFIVNGNGADNQWEPDEINPISPAVSIFNYLSTDGLSKLTNSNTNILKSNKHPFYLEQKHQIVSYKEIDENELAILHNPPELEKTINSSGSGGLRVAFDSSKVVSLGFGFEAINTSEDRAFLMYKSLTWLDSTLHETGISYVSPDNGNNLGLIELAIHGSGFNPTASAKLTREGYDDIFGIETVVINHNEITTKFDLTDMPFGFYNIVVVNPNNELKLSNGFEIKEANVDLWVDIIGRDQIRNGRKSNLWISYGNNGNICASDVFFFVSISNGVHNNVKIDSLIDSRYSSLQQSFEHDSSFIWGIWSPRILPGHKKTFQVEIMPDITSDHVKYKSAILSYVPLQILSNNDSLGSLQKSNTIGPFQSQNKIHYRNIYSDNGPEKGAILYVSNDESNPWGHTALSAGEGKVLDLWLFNQDKDGWPPEFKEMPLDYEKWKYIMEDKGAKVFDPVIPPGSSESDRRKAVDTYQTLIDDNVDFNLIGGKSRDIGMSCCGSVEYSYEKGAGIDLVNENKYIIPTKDENFLTPGLQYKSLTGKDDFFQSSDDDHYKFSFEDLIDYEEDKKGKKSDFGERFNELYDNPFSEKDQDVVTSLDPNEKAGPSGFGERNYLKGDRYFQYIVYFENVDSATAAAQEIIILDSLDTNLDFSTLNLNDICLGDTIISLSNENHYISKIINLNDTTDLQITTEFNQETGIIIWHLKGADLVYGGFGDILPPNKISPEGEGFVSYSIKSKSKLLSGTRIANSASITFDVNEAIITNEVFNTIDSEPPQSNIVTADQIGDSLSYRLIWYGADDSLGSGVKNYDIYYSNNDNTYMKWLSFTTDTSAIFTGEEGHTYSFYSIAHDSVGHSELAPTTADLVFKAEYLEPELPADFSFSQNYPNPFNPETTVKFEIPQEVEVSLIIFNVLGQKVRTLINGKKEAGYYEEIWDGKNDNGISVSSGLYIIKFKAGDFRSVKKAMFLK